jgi:diaminopimelate epimerase
MNGAGNDFVVIDNRERRIHLSSSEIARLCHRQRGVGADGLILLERCGSGRAEWAWDFYNCDGSPAEMCGNGARCFARFVQRLTGARDGLTFETRAGVITARFCGDQVTVTLTPPKDLRLDEPIRLSDGTRLIHSLDTGVPHAVVFVADAERVMVDRLGAEIRRHPRYAPRGTNVNFVQVLGPSHIRVRTYERGVEGETLACGTGLTAAALVSARLHRFSSPVKVRVQGGDTLEVSFCEEQGEFTDVRLTGPAEFVFSGRIEI